VFWEVWELKGNFSPNCENSGKLSDFRIFSGIINGSALQAPKKYVLRQETLGTYGISGNFRLWLLRIILGALDLTRSIAYGFSFQNFVDKCFQRRWGCFGNPGNFLHFGKTLGT